MQKDTIETVVYSKIIKNNLHEMKQLPVNSWMWRSRKQSIEFAIKHLRELDLIVHGYYNEKFYKVVLTYPNYEDEQDIVPMTGFDPVIIFNTCKQQTKELASLYDCRFRIFYQPLERVNEKENNRMAYQRRWYGAIIQPFS